MNIVMSLVQVIHGCWDSLNFSSAKPNQCLFMALYVNVHEPGKTSSCETHRLVNITIVREKVMFGDLEGYLPSVLMGINQISVSYLEQTSWRLIHDTTKNRSGFDIAIEREIQTLVQKLHGEYVAAIKGSSPTADITFFVYGTPQLIEFKEFIPSDDRKTAKLRF